jgi:formate dehydrogenase major subunit
MSDIALSIDGRPVAVAPGTTLLQAADAAGAQVPRLCHQSHWGGRAVCRLCMVEVGDRMVAACTTPALPGMVARTASPRLTRVRATVMQFTLADHGGFCGVPECEICALARRLGVSAPVFTAPLASAPRPAGDTTSDHLQLRHDLCVHCDRCILACRDRGVLGRAGRGVDARIVFDGGGADASGCVVCGDCVAVCPSGALRIGPRPADPLVVHEPAVAAPAVAAPVVAAPAVLAPIAAPEPPEAAHAGTPGRWVSVFIAGVVLFQLLLPLRYYVGTDDFDERFSWRMFSPIRVTACQVRWTEGAQRSPIRVTADIHHVWYQLMKRARLDIVARYAQRRCAQRIAAGASAMVYLDLTCSHPDGEVRRPVPGDHNLCEGMP